MTRRRFTMTVEITEPAKDTVRQLRWSLKRLSRQCGFRRYADELSPKERGFIETLARWRGEPTPKQIKWLTDIYERLWGRPD
jgi:hypothetical protein